MKTSKLKIMTGEMNMKSKSVISTGLWLLVGVLFTALAQAADFPAAHEGSAEQYELLLENDQVLVLKMVLAPGEADRMHSHHNETVYFERGGSLAITTAEGTLEVTVSDGHVMWHQAWVHQVTNIGDTEVTAIIVESKLSE